MQELWRRRFVLPTRQTNGQNNTTNNTNPTNLSTTHNNTILASTRNTPRMTSVTEKYADMPQCPEKSIALLKYYLQQEQKMSEKTSTTTTTGERKKPTRFMRFDCEYDESTERTSDEISHSHHSHGERDSHANGNRSGTYHDLIEQEVSYLKTSLKENELKVFNNVASLISTGGYSSAVALLEPLSRQICPFDVKEFLRLVAVGDEAATCVKGQRIILLLGGTGAGKSTTIHYLAGSKLVLESVGGVDHIGPDPNSPIKNEILRKVTTSNASKSETRNITAIPINLEDLDEYEQGVVVLCDTPGFGDTSGAEVDVSNSINIIKAVRECESVYPVVLVSYPSLGARMEYLRSFIHLIVGMIPNIDSHISSFTYLFTRFPEEKKGQIRAMFDKYMKEQNVLNQSDESFSKLLVDMLRKMRRQALVVDPLDDDPFGLMSDILKSNPIENPSEVFQFSLSEQSIASIRDQLTRNRFEIMDAVEKADYAIASYRLQEMRQLYEVLPQDFIQQTIDECVKYLVKSISERYKLAVTQFNEILAKGRLSLETIESYKRAIEHLKQTEILKKQLVQRVPDSASLSQNLINQGQKLFVHLTQQSLKAPELKIGLDNLQLLSQEFPHIHDLVSAYSDSRDLIVQQLAVFGERAEAYLVQYEYDQYGMELSQLKGGLDTLAGHVDVSVTSELVDSLVQRFTLNIQETILDQVPTYVRHPKENAKQLISCDSILRRAHGSLQLQEHIDPKEVKRLTQEFVDKILEAYNQLEDEITNLVKDEQENWSDALQHSKELMEKAKILSEIPSTTSETSKRFYGLIELLCAKLNDARQSMEKDLLKIQTLADFSELGDDGHLDKPISVIDYNRLAQQLLLIRCADWLEDYRPGVYKGSLADIERLLLDHLTEMEFMLDGLSLDLSDGENIRHVSRLLEQLKKKNWVVLLKSLPNAHETCDKMISGFKEKVGKVLGMIRQLCENRSEHEEFNVRINRFSCPLIERYFKYIDCCTKSPMIKADALDIKNELELYIRSHLHFIEQSAENAFNNIVNESEREIFTSVVVLSRCLSEISLLENTPIISAVVDSKCMNNLLELFQQCYIKLSTEMYDLMQMNQPHLVRQKVKTAKYLTVCDKYMTGSLFHSLSQQYQEAASNLTKSSLKEMHEYIEGHNYRKIGMLMSQLERAGDPQSEKHFEDAKQLLHDSLHHFVNETHTMAINLYTSSEGLKTDLMSIVDNLRKIDQANQIVDKRYHGLEGLKTHREDILQIITDKLERYMDKIDSLIESSDFEEADNQEKEIKMIKNLLGSYCPEELGNRIDKLESKIQSAFTRIIETYSNMSIAEYPLKPPKEMLEKLSQLRKQTVVEKIENALLEKVRQEIMTVKNGSNVTSSLKKLESTVKKTLTQKLVDILTTELETEIEEFETFKNTVAKEIQLAIMEDDIDTLHRHFKSKEKNSSFPLQGVLVNPLMMKLREKRNLIQQLLRKLEPSYDDDLNLSPVFKQVWDEMNLLFKYRNQLHNMQPEIRKVYEDVKGMFTQFKEDWFKQLDAFTSNPTVNVEVICSGFSLIELLMLQYNGATGGTTTPTKKQVSFALDLLGPDFMEEVKIIAEKALFLFNENQKRFVTAVENRDMSSVEKCLALIKKYSSIRKTVIDICKGLSSMQCPRSYSDLLSDLFESIKKIRDDIINIELPNEETRRSEKSREAFFEQIYQKLLMITNLKEVRPYLNDKKFEISEFDNQCLESLRKQARSLCDQTLNILNKPGALSRDNYDTVNHNYNIALSIKKFISNPFKIESGESEIKDKLMSRLEDTILKINSDMKNIENVADNLIVLQEISDGILPFKSHTSNQIDSVLDTFKKSEGAQSIAKLGVILDRDTKGVGQTLIAERGCFKGYAVSLFNSKTIHQDIDYVLKNIGGDGVDIEPTVIRRRYDDFTGMYENLVKQYLDRNNAKMPELIANMKQAIGKVVRDCKSIQRNWDATIKAFIPTLMAYVFAIWTLKNSQHYFDASGLSDKENYLLKPHASQVVSIFRMFGVGDDEKSFLTFLKGYFSGNNSNGAKNQSRNRIVNNLVEIGTGEGKSVTLAVTASVLSLLGFDVMCACYSDYLSKRDYRDFGPIFDALDVTSHIHYGTFNALCEQVINERGNVRELVEGCVRNKPLNTNGGAKSKRPKALLIDEVDVFFNKSFYGNDYVPSANLKDDSVTALTDMIWNQRSKWQQLKGYAAIREIKSSPEFTNCCQVFNGWGFLIEEAVKDMLADISSFESHDYLVIDDRIGYKEQDGISFNLTFGYKTMFAYYLEHERGQISEASLKNNISISISCGEFSYAEIPHEFDCIMGVTGTLKTLSQPEKDIVENVYKIQKNTYAPSVFGKNNRKFSCDSDIRIECEDDFNTAIVTEITSRIQGKTEGTKRAVLVFFETRDRLDAFYNSQSFALFKDKAALITEELSTAEKEIYIKRATTSGQITLLTRVFGRGTDFICRDAIVAANGGVHVIQTFLSEEISEETQIKGRTARQGDQGSYSMILLDKDLEKFLIFEADLLEMKNTGKFYNLLNEKRNEYFKQQYASNHQHVDALKDKHERTQRFVNNLVKNLKEEIKQFLTEMNRGAAFCSGGSQLSRTIVLMDATGSMSHLLHNAKNTVGRMFERAAKVLEDNGIAPNLFELQFAVYRNYNAPQESLLQCSPWESKPTNLRSFMDTIKPEYGWGPEAIEIGFWHVNQEISKGNNPNQVILIGDAPPNSTSDVTNKRRDRGENYWSSTRFANPTFYQTELQQLTNEGIQVHAFYVHSGAKQSFEEIASAGNGRCEALDIASPSGAEMLTNLVTEEILRNVGGGGQRGAELVEQYRRRYS